MNIFAVSPDPAECARALDDRRLNKMTTETAQLLSTAIHEWGEPEAEYVYKPTHRNHPCTVWVREDLRHFTWAWDLLEFLNMEWGARFGNMHGAYMRMAYYVDSVITRHMLRSAMAGVKVPTRWPNCTPYKDWHDVHAAYQQTLRDKWRQNTANGRPPQWTNRQPPGWWRAYEQWSAGEV